MFRYYLGAPCSLKFNTRGESSAYHRNCWPCVHCGTGCSRGRRARLEAAPQSGAADSIKAEERSRINAAYTYAAAKEKPRLSNEARNKSFISAARPRRLPQGGASVRAQLAVTRDRARGQWRRYERSHAAHVPRAITAAARM